MSGHSGESVFGLTGAGIYRVFRSLGRVSGVQDARPHRCRHSFATHYLENGGRIHNLKRLLGHSDIKTTEKYLEYVSRQSAIDEQYLVSPMASMRLAVA
jgi:site-specific recombinase XerD